MLEKDKLLLGVLRNNARMEVKDLAAVLGSSEEDVSARMKHLEEAQVICGYHTVINYEESNDEQVTALIQINAQPEREYGYDRIASHIYKFDEVETMYLIAGSSDLLCIVKGETMQQVAQFVASKVACIAGVTGTTTTFILKTYKNSGVILEKDEDGVENRLVVSQ